MLYNLIKEEFVMDNILIKLLYFLWYVVAPCALGWSFMDYHNYSLFGISMGLFMTFILFGVNCMGLKNK